MGSVPTIRRFILGAALVALGIGGQFLLRSEYTVVGAAVLLSAGALFSLLFWADRVTWTRDDGGPSAWTRGDWMALAAVAIAALLAAAGLILLDVHQPSAAFWRIYLVGLGALVCVPLGVVIMERVRTAGWGERATWHWLLAVVGVAAMTRMVGLSGLPFGTWYDEAAAGLEALRIINEAAYRPLYTDGVNASGHYLYLIVAAFELFGVRTESIRLISALAGVATVGAAYLAGRELFGRSIGLAFAFMLAVSRWSINFSRIGMYNALTPMFELLTIAFVARALRRNRLADYVLAGVSLGLGFCFYAAFQLFAVALALFLAYYAVVHWRPPQRLWIGLALMGLTALVVVAPVIVYAVERPDSYFARVQNTSLLARTSPSERLPAAAENLRKHLLMFNVQGDPNGRHNLPGEPMLDPMTAALFVFGIALAVARWRQPFSVLMLLWFALGLLGGVLSLDFEAPQSLRSIAALPAVYLLAALPLFVLNEEWGSGGGRYYPQAAMGLIALLLLPSAAYNLDTYFRRQAHDFASWNAFSTPETLTAKYLNELGADSHAYVISLYDNHPTVRFLANQAAPYRRLETTASMPIVDASEGNLVLVMDAERPDLFEEALRVYPGATYQEVTPPFGGPVVLYTVEVPPSAREQISGFTGEYVPSTDPAASVTRKDAQIDFVWPADAPVQPPFQAEWTGVLAAETYGPYQFGLEAPATATVYVNESPIVTLEEGGDASGGVVLPRGLHQIRIVADSGEGAVRLRWRSPDGEPELVPASVVFGGPVSNNGLLGRYYANGEWSGAPALEQIDRRFDKYFHIPVLPRPYTVEWFGKIAIPEAGQYGFGVTSNDESALSIDGKEVVRSGGAGEYGEGFVVLEAGLHDIALRFADRTDHTFVTLSWQPPSLQGLSFAARQVIPDEALFPPQGNYERVSMPSLVELGRSNGDGVTTNAGQDVSVDAEVVVSGLGVPVGLAAVPDGMAVALPELGQVVAFDAAGRRIREYVPGGESEYDEPFDLAADERGTLYVLDAGTGRVTQFGPDGAFAGTLALEPEHGSRARGLTVDGRGGVWIANTPGGTVVRFDPEDDLALTLPVMQHLSAFGEAQPVDVAVGSDGDIYVADAGVHRLTRYASDGMRLWSTELPVANTMNGSHMAFGLDGTLYVTEPENGAVVTVDPGGNVMTRWRLRVDDGSPVKPVGIAVDAEGAVWVTDVEQGRVLRFAPTETQEVQ